MERPACQEDLPPCRLQVGVALVQNQDSKWSANAKPHASPVIGAAASLVAAGLSGFAGVYLELMPAHGWQESPPEPAV